MLSAAPAADLFFVLDSWRRRWAAAAFRVRKLLEARVIPSRTKYTQPYQELASLNLDAVALGARLCRREALAGASQDGAAC